LSNIGRCFPTQYTSSSIPKLTAKYCTYWQHDVADGHETRKKKEVKASRRSIRRYQILGNFISWQNRTFELLRMSLKSVTSI
jgi:hypothetical protein